MGKTFSKTLPIDRLLLSNIQLRQDSSVTAITQQHNAGNLIGSVQFSEECHSAPLQKSASINFLCVSNERKRVG